MTQLVHKVYDAEPQTTFVQGERSMVSWITTDTKDHELDVVVTSGVDYKSYFLGKTPGTGNPCVLAFHDMGRWPLGRCEWIYPKRGDGHNGLQAKTIFDDDPESETVWRKVRSGSLRGCSIGFRPPEDLNPGEWGPPTPAELRLRPDWKGAERIIRRCVLLEYSICGLPMNPLALVAAVNKGMRRPVYSTSKSEPLPPLIPLTTTEILPQALEKKPNPSPRLSPPTPLPPLVPLTPTQILREALEKWAEQQRRQQKASKTPR